MKIIESIKDWWNIYRHLKKGEHFSRKEKRIILKMIKLSRKMYFEEKSIIYRGLCIVLDEANYKVTGDVFFTISNKLRKVYHNPFYYESQGLKLEHTTGYWWDRKDRESRLKALDILEQAIIND